MFPQLTTSTAQRPWGQPYPFFLSLRYAPESEVNSNHRPSLTEVLSEGGREPTARNHANFCPGAKDQRMFSPAWVPCTNSVKFKLKESVRSMSMVGHGTLSQGHRGAGLVLL